MGDEVCPASSYEAGVDRISEEDIVSCVWYYLPPKVRFPEQWDNFKSGIDGPMGLQRLKSLSVNASVKN